MVKIKCKRCGYTWDYKGNRNFATCPNCFFVYNSVEEKKNER